jgi:hypothetical protein
MLQYEPAVSEIKHPNERRVCHNAVLQHEPRNTPALKKGRHVVVSSNTLSAEDGAKISRIESRKEAM